MMTSLQIRLHKMDEYLKPLSIPETSGCTISLYEQC